LNYELQEHKTFLNELKQRISSKLFSCIIYFVGFLQFFFVLEKNSPPNNGNFNNNSNNTKKKQQNNVSNSKNNKKGDKVKNDKVLILKMNYKTELIFRIRVNPMIPNRRLHKILIKRKPNMLIFILKMVK